MFILLTSEVLNSCHKCSSFNSCIFMTLTEETKKQKFLNPGHATRKHWIKLWVLRVSLILRRSFSKHPWKAVFSLPAASLTLNGSGPQASALGICHSSWDSPWTLCDSWLKSHSGFLLLLSATSAFFWLVFAALFFPLFHF